MEAQAELYRDLPGIDELLREPEIAALILQEGQAATTDACRVVLSRLRDEIAAGHLDADKLRITLTGIYGAIRSELDRALGYSLKPVINASGVILHTNLGRAPLAASAVAHIRETAEAYSNLEFDLETGERGKRDVHVDRLFRKLLSQESVAPGPNGRAGVPVPTRSHETEATGLPARLPIASTIVVNN